MDNKFKRRKTFLTFGAPKISDDEINEVTDSLNAGWLGTGPKVRQFEENFRKYKKMDYSVAVNSCTAALHLCMVALKLKPGDEVITTPLTFCATVNSIIHANATPVLADIDPNTMNIDPEQIIKKITKNTKAIIPVHFAGLPCDMESIILIAKKFNLKIIEDCAHSIESEYKGKKIGSFGDFSCFSFYATKNIVTGEGGMVLTNNKKQASRIKRLALHGMSQDAWQRFSDNGYKHYQVVEAGFKYNMMDLQAAIGIHQLKKVNNFWKRREKIWKTYNKAFSSLPITLPSQIQPDSRHGYHLYTILINEKSFGIHRDKFLSEMQSRNIGVGVHYMSIPEHPFYQEKFGWKPKDFPNAMRIGRETVSLPLSPKMNNKDVIDVVNAVLDIISKI